MTLRKDFLWGGALAAHQFEGGVLNTSKGYSVADVMTAGAHGVPREITDGVVEGTILTMLVLISMDIIKKISPCLRIWDLNVLELLLLGQEFSH